MTDQLMSASSSWEEVLAGRPPGEQPSGPITPDSRYRSGRPRHEARSAQDEMDLAPRVDWRLSAWLAGVLAVCLGAVCALTWAVRAVPEQGTEVAAAEPRGTVLMVMADDGGAPLAAAVIGVEEGAATCMLAPRSLLLAAPEDGRLTSLARVASQPGSGAAVAMSRSLGLRVDGTWTLSTRGLVTLVDSLKGIEVDTAFQIGANGKLVSGQAGNRRLTGEEAAAYTTAPASRRSAAARSAQASAQLDVQRMVRFAAVLNGVLLALPDDADQLDDVLAGMLDSGQGGFRTTLPRTQVYDVMGDLHRRARSQQLTDQLLPTVPVTQGRTRGYDVNVDRLDALLTGPLAAARLPVRVVLRGDVTSPDAAAAARARLEAAKLDVAAPEAATPAAVGNPAPRTTILVPSQSAADQQHARDVAAALGVPAEIRVRKLEQAADVLVQLGQDFLARLAATPTR